MRSRRFDKRQVRCKANLAIGMNLVIGMMVLWFYYPADSNHLNDNCD